MGLLRVSARTQPACLQHAALLGQPPCPRRRGGRHLWRARPAGVSAQHQVTDPGAPPRGPGVAVGAAGAKPWPRACCGAQMGLRGPQGISEVGPGDFGGVARHLGQGGLAQRAAQMAGWGKPLQLIARGPQSLLCCDSSFLCIASGKKWIQRLSDFTCEQRSLYFYVKSSGSSWLPAPCSLCLGENESVSCN